MTVYSCSRDCMVMVVTTFDLAIWCSSEVFVMLLCILHICYTCFITQQLKHYRTSAINRKCKQFNQKALLKITPFCDHSTFQYFVEFFVDQLSKYNIAHYTTY